MLKREANLTDVRSTGETPQTDSEVSSVLSAYKSEGDPEVYEGAYTELKRFVEGVLDIYKVIYSEKYSVAAVLREHSDRTLFFTKFISLVCVITYMNPSERSLSLLFAFL